MEARIIRPDAKRGDVVRINGKATPYYVTGVLTGNLLALSSLTSKADKMRHTSQVTVIASDGRAF